MSGRSSGKIYENIKEQKEELLSKYLKLLASKFNCETIEEVFNQGYPVSDLEKVNEEVSKEVWGNNIPDTN